MANRTKGRSRYAALKQKLRDQKGVIPEENTVAGKYFKFILGDEATKYKRRGGYVLEGEQKERQAVIIVPFNQKSVAETGITADQFTAVPVTKFSHKLVSEAVQGNWYGVGGANWFPATLGTLGPSVKGNDFFLPAIARPVYRVKGENVFQERTSKIDKDRKYKIFAQRSATIPFGRPTPVSTAGDEEDVIRGQLFAKLKTTKDTWKCSYVGYDSEELLPGAAASLDYLTPATPALQTLAPPANSAT